MNDLPQRNEVDQMFVLLIILLWKLVRFAMIVSAIDVCLRHIMIDGFVTQESKDS